MVVRRLPAEWEPMDAVLLLWPHKNTEWKSTLKDITPLYEALVSIICDFADVVIALPETEIEPVRIQLEAMQVPLEYVYFYPVNTTDTWIRDYGPITIECDQGMLCLGFIHKAEDDSVIANQVIQELQLQGAFTAADVEFQDWTLQAGAIETDGKGTLLASCLLNKKLNPMCLVSDLDLKLTKTLGVNKIYWLEHGYLVDEAGRYHIDNLVRFCPNNVIVYTACDDEQDEHYIELKKMEIELQSMTNVQGEAYHLMPLPWPGIIRDDNDKPLLASYASFLVVNEAILMPIYNALSDEDALEVISQAFPGFEIIGIPCMALIERGGSLHRIAVQLPEGTLMQI